MKALAILLVWARVSSAAQDANEASIDSIFTPLADGKSPGMAVLVRKNGRTVFQRGYGMADLRTFRKIDARADFRLASFTKQFTAMSIMLLVHDGKLRYDQPITDFFPEFPAYGRAITIRHLLTHTGGLPDYEDLMGQALMGQALMGQPWTAVHQIQDDEALSLLEHQTAPKFAAGTKWAYSNSGYVVLGLIVSKVSGEPFWQFMHDRIFGPLGMNQTIAFVKGSNVVPHRAFGHTKEAGGFVETDQSATSATLGDGGVYSDLEDLAKWDAALVAHTLLGEKEMQAAITPAKLKDQSQPTAEGKPVFYGFGWFLDPYKGHARMWHSGSTMGFRTVIDRFTGEKLSVVILCNRTDVDPSELAVRVVDILWKR
jgi:CubicO group peptidase (beta-lactamase class C family)